MGAGRRHFGMARFGLKKKPKPVSEPKPRIAVSVSPIADEKVPLSPPSDVPRILLPHVETQLNMHQYNGLFEASSERQNGSTEPTGECFFVAHSICYQSAERLIMSA